MWSGSTLVTIPSSGARCRKVPSLSSASTTSSSPQSQAAFVPISFTSPPMMKLGCRPASTSTRASIEDVVVLPWVPAIAIVLRSATIASSIVGA